MNKLLFAAIIAAVFAGGVMIGKLDRSSLDLSTGMSAYIAATVEDISLAPGATAPDFDLEGVDGKRHRLSDYADAEVLAVVFTCNHCPTAQAYEDRLKALRAQYTHEQLALVAISPNDEKSVRLDELGYSDLNDSLAEMAIRARCQV